MKRYIKVTALICFFCFILSGCSNNSNSQLNINVDNHQLSYNMSQNDIENIIGKGESLGLPPDKYIDDEIEYNKSLRIAYKNHKVRYFEIDDSNIITYNNIRVGNSISDVITKYKYEQDNITRYLVAFKNGIEIDSTNKNQKPDYWIGYCYQNNTVTAIQIYDNNIANYIV